MKKAPYTVRITTKTGTIIRDIKAYSVYEAERIFFQFAYSVNNAEIITN